MAGKYMLQHGLVYEVDSYGQARLILIPVHSAQDRKAQITKIQDEMDSQLIEFLEAERVYGYQLAAELPGFPDYVCIRAVYAPEDVDNECDNFKKIYRGRR